MKNLLQNKYSQLVIAVVIGAVIGVTFYPSKTIKEDLRQKYEQEINRIQSVNEKTTTEMKSKFDSELAINKSKVDEYSKKVDKLTVENTHLKQSQKESIVRIIRPDGTIEEKIYKESQTEVLSSITTQIKEEFTRKITEIENKWKRIHTERLDVIKKDYDSKLIEKDRTIAELSKQTTVEINKKSFGVAVGYMTNKDYFSNISYDIMGPIFIDFQVQSNLKDDNAGGLGIGLRF